MLNRLGRKRFLKKNCHITYYRFFLFFSKNKKAKNTEKKRVFWLGQERFFEKQTKNIDPTPDMRGF